MYAKLGGTPWVLPSTPSVDKELVIGIGNSIIRSNKYRGAYNNRIVGIATFFSGDGQYLWSNEAKDVPYSEYFEELLKILKESIIHLEREQGWTENSTIRLIFHIFKPIKNIEFEVICELINLFPQYNIQFAFVTISKKHPFKLFDLTQKGKSSRYSGRTLGMYVPHRGANINLDSLSCLIQMLGVAQIKSEKHGSSNPILIRIRKPSGELNSKFESKLFSDIHYITQQIYSFTYLSWRTFFEEEDPATMSYSNLIARLLGNLRNINGWHPEVINFNLRKKKWFL